VTREPALGAGTHHERRHRWSRDESGTGLIGTLAGVVVILVLLLLAVQVVFDLYARSAVTAAAFDAARVVAGSDANGSPAAQSQAELAARRDLGAYGQRATFDWAVDANDVRLAVHVRNPSLLPVVFAAPLGLDSVDRSVIVRRERVR
jgi:Flp pilus assembly protein TadG